MHYPNSIQVIMRKMNHFMLVFCFMFHCFGLVADRFYDEFIYEDISTSSKFFFSSLDDQGVKGILSYCFYHWLLSWRLVYK